MTRDLVGKKDTGKTPKDATAMPDPSAAAQAGGRQAAGRLVLVLHAHLPYVRHPEHERFLEEDWLFEAMTETYIPLADLLARLADERVRVRMGLVLSPTLCEMLADPLLQSRYRAHVDRLIDCADRALEGFRGGPFEEAAVAYCEGLRWIRDLYRLWGGNLLDAFRRLESRGAIEIISCAATHGLLPLMQRETSVQAAVRAQVETGCRSFHRHFGRRPEGMWLPECAYAPGIDQALAASGVRYSFLDAHGVLMASPTPAGLVFRPVRTRSGVAFFARDTATSLTVWSADRGYPGDPVYREFHRDLGYDADLDVVRRCLHPDGVRRATGLKYHRVTGPVPLDRKEPYSPSLARQRAREHAEHFVSLCGTEARRLAESLDVRPIICAMYDAELFGHWWYEGPEFLEAVFRRLDGGRHVCPQTGGDAGVEAVSPSEALAEGPAPQVVEPVASSWGWKGYFEQWLNDSNSWIYVLLHPAEDRMTELARRFQRATGALERALNQAARELMLAQASDWAFLMATGTAADYAARRTRGHIGSFNALCEKIAAGRIRDDDEELARIEERDAIFPEMDYRVFAMSPAPSANATEGWRPPQLRRSEGGPPNGQA